ncbi:hypothetical protein Salat_1402800 [Sesamum alatum]|uniref:TF-B3 domain-containing protein n=1 Tax=Sesamum alatum TaxID=300844 RepID=A0AAE1YAZ8_9LAMI|nr:hypothetical protein Salat_1402800 [Sesamum alatum]
MESSLNPPSFFKPLIGDFWTKVSIPVEFARRYKEILPGKVCLETESQESWAVKIEQVNERHCFMGGWSEFVKGNQLEEGDFLVFYFVGRSTFRVAIFSMDGCDKGFRFSDVDGIQEPGIDWNFPVKEECGSGDGCDTTSEIPRFSVQLRKYNTYYLFFPVAFVAKTGLRRKSKITLRDPRGRKWPVPIFNRKRPNRVETSTGWNEFLTAQKLFVGSVISLESVPGSDDLFQVKVLENRGNGELLRAVNKTRTGRPRASRACSFPSQCTHKKLHKCFRM